MVDDPRTLQANERTLLAWLRTGVSLITFGFVIAKTTLWMKENQPGSATVAADVVGIIIVFLGAITEAIGVFRYVRIRRALLEHRPVTVGATDIIALAVAIALLGFLLGVYTIF